MEVSEKPPLIYIYMIWTDGDSYPLLLAGDERLEPGRHSEPELVDEGRLILAVDLNFDPGLERRLLCGGRGKRVWLMNPDTWN